MKIVFLHGLGQDEQSWKDVISYLPNSYSCKSLSLFNHLNSTDTATLDDLTKYIEVQLNQIKEPFILCGLSLGAVWNGNSFFDKFYKVQNFFPYAIPIVLDNEPPRM
ncbi:hypothetical protein EGW69_10320 [Enterococcus faecium]|nr:hypothetical protein EGW10_10970 [Enterococcus faecium]ROX61261.1 hypothetical protein EGW32_10965 [Enterococcus faecium]ROY22509.1 hypothetical protein EGW60_08655 [Enterococcus faecium]ROY56024.1 hypothetical protein EGW64_08655 [Enterococcus faecium]ROY72267.1 hypothetical protein EGW87_10315 [Enterococcus faecium]